MSRLNLNRLYWLAVIAAVGLGALLGIVGWWWEVSRGTAGWLAILFEAGYRTVLLFFGEGSDYFINRDTSVPLNYPLQIARVLAPLATFGAVIRVVLEIFASNIYRWRTRRRRHHVVICGLGERGANFALSEIALGRKVVAIEAQPLKSHEDFCDRHGIRLVRGDCQSEKTLRAAATERATHIIIATGDDNGNLKAAMRARALVPKARERAAPLKAYVSVNNTNLWREITRSAAIERRSPGFELIPFSLSVLAARRFFWDEPLYSYADLRGQRWIHAVFIGFGDYGESLLVQMLQCCAYKKFEVPIATVLTSEAGREGDRLRLHYPEIDAVAKLSFVEFDPSCRQLDDASMASVEGAAEVTAVFICLGSDDAALGAAIHVYEAMRRHGRWKSPIYVRMHKCEGVEEMLTSPSAARRFPDVIKAFGMDGDLCSVEAIEGPLEDIARSIHEGYQASRMLVVGEVPPDRQESVSRWDDLPETYRQSSRRAADHIKAKLASAGCHVPLGFLLDVPADFRLSDPDAMLEALATLEHSAWCVDRRLDGWRPGSSRDNARKIHNKLVDYADLDEPDKDYDRDQIRLVDERALKRRKDAPGDRQLIRRDHWIGLIGRNRLTAEEAAWLAEELSNGILPKLIARWPQAHVTLVTPLAPGSDYVMATAASTFLDSRSRPHRLVVPEGVPESFMLDDYREAFEGGAAWNGKPPAGKRRWLEPGAPEDGGRAQIASARDELIRSPKVDWVIDLTRPEMDYGKMEVRQGGYRLAGDYVAGRCHTLIAAVDTGVAAKPGGTLDTLGRRAELVRQAATGWPEPWPRSTIVLDLSKRTVREEIDQP